MDKLKLVPTLVIWNKFRDLELWVQNTELCQQEIIGGNKGMKELRFKNCISLNSIAWFDVRLSSVF